MDIKQIIKVYKDIIEQPKLLMEGKELLDKYLK